MIVLDTHIFVWWAHASEQLARATRTGHPGQRDRRYRRECDLRLGSREACGIRSVGVALPLTEWFSAALGYPGVRLLELTPEIAVGSTQLPGEFHRDPADQIIVATARFYDCPLITSDKRILNYPHVKTVA